MLNLSLVGPLTFVGVMAVEADVLSLYREVLFDPTNCLHLPAIFSGARERHLSVVVSAGSRVEAVVHSPWTSESPCSCPGGNPDEQEQGLSLVFTEGIEPTTYRLGGGRSSN